MKYLYQFSIDGLDKLVENELNLSRWYIRDDKIRSRTDAIHFSERYNKIKKQADNNGISYNDEEIVTWFDTLVMLYCAFGKVKDSSIRKDLRILQEYCIPYSNKRADYLFLYENRILILEFSFNRLNYELNYETKLQQAIGYKELLSNILPKEIDIGTYTFIVKPEEDEHGKPLSKEIDGEEYYPNDWKINDLANYIEKFFTKNSGFAYNAISQIED